MHFHGRQLKLSIMAVGIIFLLLFFHYIGILRPLENLMVAATRPILAIVYSASNWVSDGFLNFQSKRALLAENKELKDRVATMLVENSICMEDKNENEFLRAQLQLVEKRDYDVEIARVVGHGADNISNVLVLDKGESRGVLVGQPVLAARPDSLSGQGWQGGFLIGKIIKTRKNSALVLLINDDLSSVAAKVQNQAKTSGLVEGEYGLEIKMNLIPQVEAFKEGDIVVTSGLEELIPAGIIIGEVKKIDREPEEMFQSAALASPVNFGKVTLVSVIKGVRK